jgi:chromosome segregation ATPase
MLTACGKNSKQEEERQKELTELQTLRTQVAEQDSLINLVIQNFAQIQQLEGMISLDSNSEVPQSQRAKIEDNLRLINEKLESNRQTIDLLNKKLAQSGNKNSSLQRTIGTLQEQLNAKNAEILDLTEELKRKNYAIGVLDSMVTGLSNNVENLSKTSAAQQAEIDRQDAALNTVRYCIGTSRDLKDMNIVRNGEVVTEGYQSDYFTQIDLRKVTSIPLYEKRAELKTKHPQSSYKLVKGEDKMLTLEITNPKEFWSLSKILVIQIY